MPNAIDLTTAAVAAQELGISADATGLERLITAASRAVATYLGYPVERREDATETVKSSGREYLFLKAGALQSVSSIEVGGTAVSPSAYRIDNAIRGRIVGRGWPFTGSHTGGIASSPLHAYDTGEIEVTFTSGWVTPGQVALDAALEEPVGLVQDLPEDLEQAALETITAWYRRKGRDGDLSSVALGGASMSYDGKGAIPAPARQLLASYRKRVG